VNLDYKKQGPSISTAILDSNGTTVVMIQLRQAGATVPDTVFCLKNLQSLDIMNMNFVNGNINDQSLLRIKTFFIFRYCPGCFIKSSTFV
jgi:hypothetical protein